MRIEMLAGEVPPEVGNALADVLVDCVAGGASVGFPGTLGHDEARRWWHRVVPDPDSVTWIARDDGGRIVATVRLILATQANAGHRAEVSKLLVHRDARGRGYADALMSTVEEHASRLGRRVLILDTQTDSPGESLYARRGWRRVGVIDDYATTPDGRLAPTTIMTKQV